VHNVYKPPSGVSRQSASSAEQPNQVQVLEQPPIEQPPTNPVSIPIVEPPLYTTHVGRSVKPPVRYPQNSTYKSFSFCLRRGDVIIFGYQIVRHIPKLLSDHNAMADKFYYTF